MLRPMFGMGGTEIIVILIVALLFLGPDKLPEAAKTISKGIRDIKRQSRALQQTIEDDEHIGGAIRDLKSALRGEYEPPRPRPPKPNKQLVESSEPAKSLPEPGTPEHGAGPDQPPTDSPSQTVVAEAGEPDDTAPVASTASDDAELAAMVKPATHAIPHQPPSMTGSAVAAGAASSVASGVASGAVPADPSESKHG
jgi:sec-independent protein translocase protein TatB